MGKSMFLWSCSIAMLVIARGYVNSAVPQWKLTWARVSLKYCSYGPMFLEDPCLSYYIGTPISTSYYCTYQFLCLGISRILTCEGLSSFPSKLPLWSHPDRPLYVDLPPMIVRSLSHCYVFPLMPVELSGFRTWAFIPINLSCSGQIPDSVAQVQRAACGSCRVVVQNVVSKLSIWVQWQGRGWPPTRAQFFVGKWNSWIP